MLVDKKVLVLSGTREGAELERHLMNRNITVISTIHPDTGRDLGHETQARVAGFQTYAEFDTMINQHAITHVIDASHPMDAETSTQAKNYSTLSGLPFLNVTRAPWRAGTGDIWHYVSCERDVASVIISPARVFLATGRMGLQGFENLGHCYLFCRQIEIAPDTFPYPNGEYVLGHPPFSVIDEMTLFERLRIDWLVLRNAGGERSKTKLVAARNLGISVAMIDRPKPVDPTVKTPIAALDWLDRC